MKRWVSLPLIGITIVIACSIPYRATRNYLGYCSSTGRRLTDDEKIRIAVRTVIRENSPGGELFIQVSGRAVRTGRRFNDDSLPYVDVDDFLAINRNCCRVVDVWPEIGASPGWYARLTGEFSGFVRLDFLSRKKEDDGQVSEEKRRGYVALTNCGRTWSGID
jgi:hypothetical protein